MSFKILTAADLHLGKKSSGVSAHLEESSVTYTWHRMVEWAVQYEVDALVLAGDVIDRDNRYFEAIGPIREGLKQLGEAGIPVMMIAGNHDFDVLPQVINNNNYEHVYLLGQNGRWEVQTVNTDKGALQFVGWSFPQEHVYETPLGALSSSNIPLDANKPTLGLLHGELNNAESRYAPIAMNDLVNTEVDTWILGHIHKPQVKRTDKPLVFYAGSPQALSPKESGSHGPCLLTIDEDHTVTHEQIFLSPIRYETLEIDVERVTNKAAFRNRVVESIARDIEQREKELQHVRQIIYDLYLTGRHKAKNKFDGWIQHIQDFEQTYIVDTTASVRSVVNQIEPKVQNLEELAGQPDPTGVLAKAILDLQAGNSSDFLDVLLDKFSRQLRHVNTARTYQPLKQDDRQYTSSDDMQRKFLLQECERLLANLLSQKDQNG